MKKMITLSACLVAGIASADLDINFGNDSTPVTAVNSAGSVGVDQVLAQLIWTSSVPTAQARAGAALGSGEFLLSSYLTASGGSGTFAPQGVITYLNSDVGNVDINAGYFFVRMFDNSVKAVNDWYLQFDLVGPVLTEYNIVPRPTPYLVANLLPGGSAIDLNDATYGQQVIPEPAVASLLVIFGGSLMAGRRLFAKKA